MCRRFGRGTRIAGHYFRVWNFNASALQSGADALFAYVGVWNAEDNVVLCGVSAELQDDTYPCGQAVYHSASRTYPPSDVRPTVYVEMHGSGLEVVCYVLGVVLLLEVCGFSAMMWVYRESKLVRVAQPVMLWVILGGGALCAVRIMMLGGAMSDGLCVSGVWVAHVAYWLVVGPLLLKAWRIDKILNNKSLRRVTVTTRDVLVRLSCLLGVLLVYLCVFTVVSRPHVLYSTTTTSNQDTSVLRCGLDYSELDVLLFVLEAVGVLAGLRLSWNTRHAPGALNDSAVISQGA